MAQITGAQGAAVTQQLSQYLIDNAGVIDATAIANIINASLPPNERLGVASGGVLSQGIFKKFGEFDKISNKIEVVTEGLWSNGSGSLNGSMVTGSTTTIAGHSGSDASKYYLNVYLTGSNTGSSAPVEFAIAYGHKFASGSVQLTTSDSALLPTKAIYSQYRMLLNDNYEGEADEYFTVYSASIEDGYQIDHAYVINLARARYRQQADAGNFTLTLSGSNGIRYFIDDSGKKFSDKAGKAGTVFNIVSGSTNVGTEAAATINTYTASNQQGFGKFYPKLGIMLLNPTALASVVGSELLPTTGSTSVETYNQKLLFNAIFVSGSDGTFREPSFKSDPKTYIPSVGLYNDANELIAVAKTSQPIAKSFDKEVLIKVKLDF